MQLQLNAPKIWLANEPVDFRKGFEGLNALVTEHFNRNLENHLYVFYNRAKNKLKLLAYHRNGAIMIYKRLDKKRFTLKQSESTLYEISEQQLAWLLAGLDWIAMSKFEELTYEDYF